MALSSSCARAGLGLTALAAIGAGELVAQRSDFELRRELAAGRMFQLSNIVGDVRVTGGSGRTVEVTAVKRAGRHGEPEDVTIETVELDDGLAVCVRYPGNRRSARAREGGSRSPCSTEGGNWNSGDRNDTEVEFTVRVPNGLRLRIGTVSGDVYAEGLDGTLELRSVSGDVRLTSGVGPVIDLKTVSGDVDLLDVTSKEVVGQTVSGEIVFRGPLQQGGSYDFASTSGDIEVSLPRQPDATLTAATFSGRMSSDLPINQDSGRRRRHRYDATWGSGSAKLAMESLSGNLIIRTGR